MRRQRPGRVLPTVALVAALGAGAASGVLSTPVPAGASAPRVLLVGTFHGVRGQYRSIQAAVNAARPGDWVLVAPGDYHEAADASLPVSRYSQGADGAVVIATPRLHLRGMNRNSVIVDGTKPGASVPCSAEPSVQNLGPTGTDGKPTGRNGIVVWKASGVSIQNLTACNFLSGGGDAGNEIWWNGGDGSGKIGLAGYWGSYLTGTSTFYAGEQDAASYGIFSSNSAGPASWYQVYGSNMNDSGSYVGACQQRCNIVINHAWMEYNALGYSGTNSGGAVIIENSRFDNNQDGLDTNTQIDGDPPAPQNGKCPGGKVSPITHTTSCWVAMHNLFIDNDNPNVPKAGSASAGPTGTGMTLSGGHNDTVMDNTFEGNGAWGILFVPYPDSGTPVLGQTCAGTGGFQTPGFGCVYEPTGDALLHNTFAHNGYFGNPGNADFGEITINSGIPSNCFVGNVAPNGSSPANLEQTKHTCGVPVPADDAGPLLGQVLCDTGFGTCPAGAHYPQATQVVMHPLPSDLPTMRNPCAGVPANPWCRGGRPV